jgi:putative DNA primase/helicase
MSTANTDSVTATVNEGKTFDTGFADALAEGNPWFPQLPAAKQAEVAKYAVLHISNNSSLFERNEHGGNDPDYERLTIAIARSGLPDAETIFVEAALSANEPATEDDLRKFFRAFACGNPDTDGITAGTLFNIARRYGADFGPWEKTYADFGRDAVLFAPGNEEECRKQLDRVVAADPRTYTLGDPTGPLVILRVPAEDDLPREVRWEGDLPGTTLALAADIMQRAERLTWVQRAGGTSKNRINRTGPPRTFIGDYLTQMRGNYSAPPLRGVVRVPRIDRNGIIHFISGYDSETGLFHDRSPSFHVPLTPSQDEALGAAKALLDPFSQYQFDDPLAGKALLLAAIFTAIERPFLPVAPMFVIRSSMPGTGKGLIVRTLVRLAFDTMPIIATWGGSGEEFEKRLGALLLQAPGALSIDNANGMQVKGDLLEAILTEGSANIRPLGVSETVRVRNRSLITLTGNNPIITGDMARRTLPIDILPRSADPEQDRYGFNPAEYVQRHRIFFLRAAFIVMRAFRLAGMPRQGLPGVGSFDEWSRKIRDLVYWLTGYDVGDGFRRNKAEDPRRQGDAALLAALHLHFGTAPFKGADVITIHKRVADHRRAPHPSPAPTPMEQAVYEALENVLSSRNINAKLFGYWALRVKGARVEGFMLETHHNTTTNSNDITILKI